MTRPTGATPTLSRAIGNWVAVGAPRGVHTDVIPVEVRAERAAY